MVHQLQRGQFYGRTVRQGVWGGLSLADVRYPALGELPRHSHERAYFCLIREGIYTESYGRRTRTCRPMTIAFHPPGEPHAETIAGSPVSSFNVEISTKWLNSSVGLAGLLDQPGEFHGGETALLGLRLFREFACAGQDSTLALESLVVEILSAFARRSTAIPNERYPVWLRRTRDLLQARFAEPLTLRRVAGEAGVHPVYFAAAFRKLEGCSVGEYLRRRRLEHVRRRLAGPDVPLADLALDAGFADQSHLTRTFKRFTGMTPARYRTFLRFKNA